MLALLKADGRPQIDPQSQCFRGKVCRQRIYLLSLSSSCQACLAKVMKDYLGDRQVHYLLEKLCG